MKSKYPKQWEMEGREIQWLRVPEHHDEQSEWYSFLLHACNAPTLLSVTEHKHC